MLSAHLTLQVCSCFIHSPFHTESSSPMFPRHTLKNQRDLCFVSVKGFSLGQSLRSVMMWDMRKSNASCLGIVSDVPTGLWGSGKSTEKSLLAQNTCLQSGCHNTELHSNQWNLVCHRGERRRSVSVFALQIFTVYLCNLDTLEYSI